MVRKPARKPSMGRQKIEIKKIEKDEARQVTFSKRRGRLFKKASELCILCGAEVLIIVFSHAGKAFSFGYPRMETIIDRFLTHNTTYYAHGTGLSLVDAQHGANVHGLNRQLTLLHNQLETEKKKGERLIEMRKASQKQYWWEAPVETLNLHQLEQMKSSLEELKRNIANCIDQMPMENAIPLHLPMNQVNPITTGNSVNPVFPMSLMNLAGASSSAEPKTIPKFNPTMVINNGTIGPEGYDFSFASEAGRSASQNSA